MTDDVRSGTVQRLSAHQSVGYVQDLFGNWLRGGWRAARPNEGPSVIPSADSLQSIALGEIEGLALPVYQGVMIAPLSPSAATYALTGETRGDWVVPRQFNEAVSPQYLMKADVYRNSKK